MSDDRTTPPAAVSTVASASTTEQSNRASPYSSSTSPTDASINASPVPALFETTLTTGTTGPEAMATPGFLAPVHPFPTPIGISPHNPTFFNMTATQSADHEGHGAVGNRYAQPPPSPVSVRIRRLPLNTSEESLRLMVVWSQELVDAELVPVAESDDEGFLSAILRFRTMAGAQEAKKMLGGRINVSKDAEMVVEILSNSPVSSRRQTVEPPSTTMSNGIPSSNSSAHGTTRQAPRYNGPFQPLDSISSPPVNGVYAPTHELPNPDASAHYQALFSPQSPIGNHVAEINRVSGKSLIASDSPDDDETTNLLKDPVAYAENGATSQRRATAPQIPISRMAGLSLNTNNPPSHPGSSSLPPYVPMSAQAGPMSPMNNSGAGMPYTLGAQAYQRHNFPPVNPADQNPPCNTLYVGNLPLDTSEEELKALFAKQRGYKRLCFRTKQNGPMCFVEFEDISFATKALHELYGQPLHNSVKGGIRLSFSKNPLGVRSGQAPGQSNSNPLAGLNGMMPGPANGFTTANGPPPGLSAPPGLGSGRGNYHGAAVPNGHSYSAAGFGNASWNGAIFTSQMTTSGGVPSTGLPSTAISPTISPSGVPSNSLTLNGLLSTGLPSNGIAHNGLSPNGGKNVPGNSFPPHMMGR